LCLALWRHISNVRVHEWVIWERKEKFLWVYFLQRNAYAHTWSGEKTKRHDWLFLLEGTNTCGHLNCMKSIKIWEK
jgi:hypothetical protein